jgi:tetratricopeptide (TPR) repeat protein
MAPSKSRPTAPPPPAPRPPAPASEFRLGGWFALTALLCLGLLCAAYSDFFGNAFQFDDTHVLENNLYLRSLANIPRFFTDARTSSSLPANQLYRPLVSFTLALDYHLAQGLAPTAYHADQLAELALLGIALWAFYRMVMDRAAPASRPGNAYLALFAATLFAVHTVQTETMNLMHARSEILSALGVVVAFLVYLGAPRLRRFHLYLLPVAFGALAKTPAVLFAALLFAWELFRPEDAAGDAGEAIDWRGRLRRAALAALPAFLFGVALFWFVEVWMASPTRTYGGHDRLSYAATQAWVWLHYLRLFILPVGLTADSDLQLVSAWYDTRVIAGLAAILGLAVLVWRAARRRDAWPVAFGLTWFAIGLTPTSSIVPLAEPMNEHRVFLPFIGLVLAAVWGARVLLPAPHGEAQQARVFAACAVLLLALAVGTYVRNEVWHTGESLWSDVTVKSPGNGRAWTNYGVALMGRGQYAEAKACFERAALLVPNYWTLEINRGIVEGAMGNARAAEAHFRRSLLLGPSQPETHYYFARWLIDAGRTPEAIGHLERAVALSPGADNARALLAQIRTPAKR